MKKWTVIVAYDDDVWEDTMNTFEAETPEEACRMAQIEVATSYYEGFDDEAFTEDNTTREDAINEMAPRQRVIACIEGEHQDVKPNPFA